ncbi:uroporphyrinogen-III C-methyltransferase [Robertkochia aurantiaca]|uniref:uroporphyrinogen-III C-methyltransferase n=1 Tax=Robertkochia aurantiaca TaxID=2873700 RepID=UPI001CCB5D23|nr:uroporphyrinogen-III C-methyltransferase [Robertkochia sp. 3YJGBD-33]
MKALNNQPKVTLLGAGPGDPELITLKGLKALGTADVVLYDALIDKQLLRFVPRGAELIFVGKRKGCYAYQQDQINELMVSRAESHGHVVRLKGGDPFVFGRGAEEMTYVKERGIPVTVIPGLSSALSVPALQSIPMTQRKVSESFWVITGTTRDHELSADIQLAARSTATVVILMGMSRLNDICELFCACGRGGTPMAVIQNGTMPDERIVTGPVRYMPEMVREEKIANPAVIVIGDVVNHRHEITALKEKIRNQQLQTHMR